MINVKSGMTPTRKKRSWYIISCFYYLSLQVRFISGACGARAPPVGRGPSRRAGAAVGGAADRAGHPPHTQGGPRGTAGRTTQATAGATTLSRHGGTGAPPPTHYVRGQAQPRTPQQVSQRNHVQVCPPPFFLIRRVCAL